MDSNNLVRNNAAKGNRRGLLKLASSALTVTAVTPTNGFARDAVRTPEGGSGPGGFFDVKKFGATGDGKTLDTAAIDAAIQAAVGVGGGRIYFPAGTYASYSICETTSGFTWMRARFCWLPIRG